MDHKDLQFAGLTETEAKIYLAALELGETVVSRIARQSGIKRTTVYLSLENLKKMGLVSTTKKEGKLLFYAEDPRKIEQLMEERKNRISQLMPELVTFAKFIDKKPEVRFFEGAEGIKEVFRDTLNYPDQEICMWYSESYQKELGDEFFSEYYRPQRKAKKIFARALLPDNEIMRKMILTDEQEFKKSRLLPIDVYKINIEILIYGKNKVGILSYAEKFALIIESPQIHESLKSIFETMWQTAKEK